MFVLLLFAQPFPSALGQNAQIAGTVTDPSKAVIPKASIEIIETATQVKWDTISNGDGRYVAPSLAPGVYQITVQAPTFETQMVWNLRLNVASKVSLDFVLHPGAASQSVTVGGSGINLNTTDASVSTVIIGRAAVIAVSLLGPATIEYPLPFAAHPAAGGRLKG